MAHRIPASAMVANWGGLAASETHRKGREPAGRGKARDRSENATGVQSLDDHYGNAGKGNGHGHPGEGTNGFLENHNAHDCGQEGDGGKQKQRVGRCGQRDRPYETGKGSHKPEGADNPRCADPLETVQTLGTVSD